MVRTNTRRMHLLRDQFFAEGKQLDADERTRDQANCWICKARIDYAVDPNTTDDSHNLDHYFDVHKHPELQEDPTNFRHSHMACNGLRSDHAPSLGLGEAVPDWWVPKG